MSPLDALVEELAERVAAKVLAKLSAAPSHYSAKNPPPGKSRAWALRTIKTIPGAKKIGRDWTVSVDAFDAWLSERDMTRVSRRDDDVRQSHSVATEDVQALAELALSESGLRRVRAPR